VWVDFGDALQFALVLAVADAGTVAADAAAAAAAGVVVVVIVPAGLAFALATLTGLGVCAALVDATGLAFAGATDARVGAVDAAIGAVVVIVIAALAGRGAIVYGILRAVWYRGCNEFELVSPGLAGIAASRAGKLAWVEVDELTTLSFVAVVSRLAGGSVSVERVVVDRGKRSGMGMGT
jgi:hypothetical protein